MAKSKEVKDEEEKLKDEKMGLEYILRRRLTAVEEELILLWIEAHPEMNYLEAYRVICAKA